MYTLDPGQIKVHLHAPRPESFEDALTLVEDAHAYWVVRASDPTDWVARFEKGQSARSQAESEEWARRMVDLHNRSLAT